MTFDELCSRAGSGPEFRRMKAFGRDGLLMDGKAVLVAEPEGVVFRVGAKGEASALAVPGAAPWSPMAGRGGPKGWVLVPRSASDEWPRLAEAAKAFVRGLAG